MSQITADMLQSLQAAIAESKPAPEPEISLVELATILLRRKRLIAGSTLGAAAIAAIVVSFIPPTFKAEATILPPQEQQSSLAAFASGALGGLAGSSMASSLGLKNPADLYIGILGSRTISDDMIGRFHLHDVYGKKLQSDTRKALANYTSFTAGKDSLISISVEDHDPKRAADMANAFVDELYRANSRLAITTAAQRRLFFEQELAKEKDALAAAEVALKNTEQATGLLAPTGQAEVLLRSGAQLRAEIASREVQLQALRTYATEENPKVEVLKREIEALRGQLSSLESKDASGSAFNLSAGKLPQSSLEYIRKARDLKYHETLYELLAKQYEAARIDEAKQAAVIQVVDRAVVPDKKNSPNRTLIIALAAAAGLLGALSWTAGAELLVRRELVSPRTN